MKKIIVLLSVLLLTAALFLSPSASAKSLDDLSTVYSNMTQHIYKPYFENSPSYSTFEATLHDLGTFVKGSGQTQEQIDYFYCKIRTVYAQMMKETFNYQSIIENKERFDQLESSLYTKESWDALYQAAMKISDELSAPTLYTRNDTVTLELYTAAIDKHIQELSDQFVKAYTNLELILPQEKISRPQFNAFVYYIKNSAPQAVMGNSSVWQEFHAKLLEQEDLITWRLPAQWRLDNGSKELLALYEALVKDAMNYDSATAEIARYDATYKSLYTENSFLRYEAQIEALKVLCEKIPYLYYPTASTDDEKIFLANDYTAALTIPASAAYEQLISRDLYDDLLALCTHYRTVPAKEGLEAKWDLLDQAIAKGFATLSEKNALPEDFENATLSLQQAASDYEHAVRFYTTPTEEEPESNDVLKKILVFSLIAVLASAMFALYASYRFYGRIYLTR